MKKEKSAVHDAIELDGSDDEADQEEIDPE